MMKLFPWKICTKAVILGGVSVILSSWNIILSQILIFTGLALIFHIRCQAEKKPENQNDDNLTDENAERLAVILYKKQSFLLILTALMAALPLLMVPSEYAAGMTGAILLILACIMQTFLTIYAIYWVKNKNFCIEILFIALVLAAIPGFLIEQCQVIFRYPMFLEDIICGVLGSSFFCGFCGFLVFSSICKFPTADSKYK